MLHQKNHYVPKMYLKRWENEKGKVLTYRILVPHEQVPLWKPTSVSGIAYLEHLYTRTLASGESDEIEKWLDSEFESPAEESILKVTKNLRLQPSDWTRLINFVAAQDVRTPARLAESLMRWNDGSIEKLLNETLLSSVEKWKRALIDNTIIETEYTSDSDLMPLRIKIDINPSGHDGSIGYETVIGRGLWLFELKRLLTNTQKVLHEHRWTIFRCPENFHWVTSDNPVVRLNYYSPSKYDFGGGWGRKGTEIFVPLGTKHLMYTKIGNNRPPIRYSVLSLSEAMEFQKLIIQNAYRSVFSSTRDQNVPHIRPRTVNAEAYLRERDEWKRWHNEQTNAERPFLI